MKRLAVTAAVLVTVLLAGWVWVYQTYEIAQKEADGFCQKGKYAQAREVITAYQSKYVAYPILNFQVLDKFAKRLAYVRGTVSAGLGAEADAEAEFLQASAASEPNVASAAHYNLAVYFGERGELDAAIDRYRQALQLMPGDTQIQINLELMLKKADQRAKKEGEQKGDNKDDPQYQSDLWFLNNDPEDSPVSAGSKRIWR